MWSTINALQLFDEVYFLTKGGPLFSTYVLVYYVFDLAFQKGLAGYAAAVAYVLFAAILVLTAQLAIGRLGHTAWACDRQSRSVEPGAPRRLRFSPWHLLLLPLALVMVTPLL